MRIAMENQKYLEILENLKQGFPRGESDPVHDAYVGFTIMRVLDQLDQMKSRAPFLGERTENNYEAARKATMDDDPKSVEDVIPIIMQYLNGGDLWAHPLSQMNVTPPVSLPALIGNIITGILSPNITWDEASRKFAEVEVEVCSLVAEMVGYDKQRSIGWSVYGGSGAVLYGVKMMIAKACREAAQEGLREDVKIIASDVAHSCKYNAVDWLGIGKKNLVTIPTDEDNSMLLEEMKQAVFDILDRGEKLGGFICTMGTTDAFGIDNISFIAGLRDHVLKKYNLDYRPHIHADAVIGWAYTVFNDYNFEKNHLGFSKETLKSIYDTYLGMENIRLADSIGVDFHKTGYTQYISTLFMLKDKNDLNYISRNKEDIPYIYQTGNYHPGLYTLELSRSASGVFSALANLRFLGKDGFRVLLSHPVEMANALRKKLKEEKSTTLLNRYNYGPVTLFRVYPDGIDAEEQYQKEIHDENDEELLKYNKFNNAFYLRIREESRKGNVAVLSETSQYRMAESGSPINAIKSYILTPFCEVETIDVLFDTIMEIKKEVEKSL
jgi:L-2,4-diaminobutyrate decarboxylase